MGEGHYRYEMNLQYSDETDDKTMYLEMAELILNGKAMINSSGGVTLAVENRLLSSMVNNWLKSKGHYTDTSFNRELLKIKREGFLELAEELFDEKTTKEYLKKINKITGKDYSLKSFLGKAFDAAASQTGKKLTDLGFALATGGASELLTFGSSVTDTVKSLVGATEVRVVEGSEESSRDGSRVIG
ncbi:MAG: hypothetical protein IIA59_12515 [Candidatus Marinimicrobia bacterium]|nr:hypothetical protein [Candidatus Neomarinimicrobiota bacterium]